MATKEEMMAKGYKYYCMECHKVYAEVPQEIYEDGHGGRPRTACKRCGCDLIATLATDEMVKG
jgi:predicted nucleic acid-binding Zn ribbon protein